MQNLFNLFFILIICVFDANCQENGVLFSSNDFHLTDSVIEFDLVIENQSDELFAFLKPDMSEIEYGILQFVLSNDIDTFLYDPEKINDIFVSEDIECIRLNCVNSVSLGKNESFIKKIVLIRKNFSHEELKGVYVLETFLNMHITSIFSNQTCKIYKKGLECQASIDFSDSP